MAFVSRQVSPVWPPTGLALAALLLLGQRAWPGIFVGALLANATAGEPLLTAIAIAGGNTLEAAVGAWLLTRRPFRPRLDGFLDALAWVAVAAAASTTIAATIGVASLCAGGVQPWSSFAGLWRVWWLGDALGTLVVGSLLVTWLSPAAPDAAPTRGALRTELPAIAVGAVAVALLVFLPRTPLGIAGGPALEYTAFPFIVWAGMRCGPRGVSLISFLVSLVAIAGTLRGGGPFASSPLHEGLVLLQTYMAVVAATGLLLAAAIAERDRVDERKDEFLAMLGHELRNPLGAIRNASPLLEHRAGDRSAGRRSSSGRSSTWSGWWTTCSTSRASPAARSAAAAARRPRRVLAPRRPRRRGRWRGAGARAGVSISRRAATVEGDACASSRWSPTCSATP